MNLELLRADLVSPVDRRLSGLVDVLVFNPPYVPTEADELGTTSIAASWAGGKDGMEITNRLLPLVKVNPNRSMWISLLPT